MNLIHACLLLRVSYYGRTIDLRKYTAVLSQFSKLFLNAFEIWVATELFFNGTVVVVGQRTGNVSR
jgi:hypothetical protein